MRGAYHRVHHDDCYENNVVHATVSCTDVILLFLQILVAVVILDIAVFVLFVMGFVVVFLRDVLLLRAAADSIFAALLPFLLFSLL